MKNTFPLLILLFIGISCSPKIANYKATRNGYQVFSYSLKGETRKHILANGDTICSGENYSFQIHVASGDTTWFIKP